MKIDIRKVSKAFGYFPALDAVDVTVPSGELVALLGPSGSGKTTLLRVIAGLETPETGHVIFGETDVTDHPVRTRNVGFVFQHYALFQHMTVAQNIAFGLRVRKASRAETAERVAELVSLMQLDGLERRLPSELSGGQRQRVALARALAPNPKVLLLDEPFGALDARVRQDLRRWLRRLHNDIHVTTVFVTHDQEEAFEVADRVVILNNGRVEQSGAPDDIFDHPANAFVMDFVGNVNVLDGMIDHRGSHFCGLTFKDTYKADIPVVAKAYIRSGDIEYCRSHDDSQSTKGIITYARRVGPVVRTLFSPKDSSDAASMEVELSLDDWRSKNLKVGAEVNAKVKRVRIFPERGEYDNISF
ncbi:MAG: sulfate ABC transporter ATP-binding protein [Deltaproteobacteria bacterium]|nr:sulfate ABC transporter ATP-binding protein [Deltaproteobacteria bacterium]